MKLGKHRAQSVKALLCEEPSLSGIAYIKSQCGSHACNPSTWEAETGRSWNSLARQPSLFGELQVSERPCLKTTREATPGNDVQGRPLTSTNKDTHTQLLGWKPRKEGFPSSPLLCPAHSTRQALLPRTPPAHPALPPPSVPSPSE